MATDNADLNAILEASIKTGQNLVKLLEDSGFKDLPWYVQDRIGLFQHVLVNGWALMSPREAADAGVHPYIIFIAEDKSAVGAPREFVETVYYLKPKEWTHFYIPEHKVILPMSDFHLEAYK